MLVTMLKCNRITLYLFHNNNTSVTITKLSPTGKYRLQSTKALFTRNTIIKLLMLKVITVNINNTIRGTALINFQIRKELSRKIKARKIRRTSQKSLVNKVLAMILLEKNHQTTTQIVQLRLAKMNQICNKKWQKMLELINVQLKNQQGNQSNVSLMMKSMNQQQLKSPKSTFRTKGKGKISSDNIR